MSILSNLSGVVDQAVISAQITIGNINVTDDLGQYNDDLSNNDLAIWEDYVIQNHYEGDLHTYMMGITSPGGFQGNAAAFVKLAGNTQILICDWSCSRWSVPPDIPDPVSKDPNWILLDCWVEPSMLVPTGGEGATMRYRISGTYIYGARSVAAGFFANAVYPIPPWMPQQPRQQPSGDLVKGLQTL